MEKTLKRNVSRETFHKSSEQKSFTWNNWTKKQTKVSRETIGLKINKSFTWNNFTYRTDHFLLKNSDSKLKQTVFGEKRAILLKNRCFRLKIRWKTLVDRNAGGYPGEPGGMFGREKCEEKHENTTKNKEKEPKIHQKARKWQQKHSKTAKTR